MAAPLVLRKLTPADEHAFIRAVSEWDGSPGFMFARGFVEGSTDFEEYLKFLDANERGEDLPEGFVPETLLCGFVGGEIVGRLSIRHRLTEFLNRIGGHIGYGVLPQHRRRGYATAMLRQALPMAHQLGISRVLVTCDDDNIGSAKTIEACGGVLENKVSAGDDKPLKRRYWIDLG